MRQSEQVVSAPIAGFYFNNKYEYNGPGALGVIPLNVDALEKYWCAPCMN